MKYEYTYGQEEKELVHVSHAQKHLYLLHTPGGSLAARRWKETWNVVVFCGIGSAHLPSSVVSSFAFSSRELYSDELHGWAERLSSFIRTVAWPDPLTVDRHYFHQILVGVVMTFSNGEIVPRLCNPTEYLSGREDPNYELEVKSFDGKLSRKRKFFHLS